MAIETMATRRTLVAWLLLPLLWSAAARASAHDFDGDRRADILWRSLRDGRHVVWLVNGTSVTTVALPPPGGEAGWIVAATGDFDGDLAADVLWRRPADGRSAIALMTGAGARATVPGPPLDDGGWRAAGAGDFTGDRRDDVLWRHADGRNQLWVMDGGRVASSVALASVVEPGWIVSAVADVDGDATADILWRHVRDGRNVVWLMDGTSAATVARLPPLDGPGWRLAGVGEFNGDRASDLLWRNGRDGRGVIWLMHGTAVTASALAPAEAGWRVAGVGDFNGDRRSDLLWRHAADGRTRVWLMNGTTVTSSLPFASVAREWAVVEDGFDTLAVLDGATNYTGSYPAPGAVTFSTKDGRSVRVKAFPGQVQVFAQASANQANVAAEIASKGGTVLSRVPQLGYYLVSVRSGTESAFISSIRSSTGVLDAVPNTAMRVRADAVPINEDYFLTERPVPLNVGPGVVVIDQNFNAGGHGNDVANTVRGNGGTVGALVNLGIQCAACNGETSAHHIGLILTAAIQGNSVFNPGTPFLGNVSFGPELGNGLLAEQVPAADVAANQAENETFIRSILSVTRQIPAAQNDYTVTFALGNSHVDLSRALANLRDSRELSAELHDHFLLTGTSQGFSNYVNGRDIDVVVSNNREAADGTSFAAPAMGAAIQVVRRQTGATRDVAQLAVKLVDDADRQATAARASTMATQVTNALPQIVSTAGVTREQALLAVEHAVHANASGQLVLQEAVQEARVLKEQGGCCVQSNGCPGETGTECGAGCCCCGLGQRCCADIRRGCCYVGTGSWVRDVLRSAARKLPFLSSYFPEPRCPVPVAMPAATF